ncbi:MAG TPA: PIN domain-containing protein [Pirellulaceae bacterium]|jgi:predicted nucleic acid-binding protein
MNAIDTNVLVYLFDVDDATKRSLAMSAFNSLLRSPTETVLLWQVACEFLGCLRRWQSSGKLSADDGGRHFQDIVTTLRLIIPSPKVLDSSVRLMQRYSLSHWDSLLVAAAIEAGVDTLYTEDLQAGAQYETVKVVNPLA